MKFSVKQHKGPGENTVTHNVLLCMDPLFLLTSIVLTVNNSFSAMLVGDNVGQIDPGTLGAALACRCSVVSGSSMPLSGSMLDSLSASQSSWLTFGSSMSLSQTSQFSVSQMLSGALSSSHSARWQSILLNRWKFSSWVRPPWRAFAHKPGGTGDLSDNLNAATPSCGMFDQDTLTISSVSEMCPTAVIWTIWAWESSCVARRCYVGASAKCEIGFRKWTPRTKPSPHSPQIIQVTYLQSLTMLRSIQRYDRVVATSQNVFIHLS